MSNRKEANQSDFESIIKSIPDCSYTFPEDIYFTIPQCGELRNIIESKIEQLHNLSYSLTELNVNWVNRHQKSAP